MPEKYLTTAQAAEKMNLPSSASVRALITLGELPSAKKDNNDRFWLISESDIISWVQNQASVPLPQSDVRLTGQIGNLENKENVSATKRLLLSNVKWKDHPLLRFFLVISNQRVWQLYLISLVFYSIFILSLGIFTSISNISDPDIVTIFDWRELIWTIYLYFIFQPIVWVIYTFQLSNFIDVFNYLTSTGLIKFTHIEYEKEEYFLDRYLAMITHRYVPRVAFVIFIIVIGTYLYPFSQIPTFNYGSNIHWLLYTDSRYVWFIWAPVNFFAGYLIIVFSIRQFIIVYIFHKMFKTHKVSLFLFHPDNCNGYQKYGNYCLALVGYVFLMAIWVLIQQSLPSLFGQPILSSNAIVWIVTSFYLSLFPIVILPPIIIAHNAMEKEKRSLLLKQAQLIHQSIQQKNHLSKSTSELVSDYELIRKNVSTWPFRLFRFGFSAFLPAVPGVIVFIIELLTTLNNNPLP